jgi:hypothetical protein
MAIGKEDLELIILFDWLRFNKLDHVAFHPANERRCTAQQGALLKRKGVTAGVSDVIFLRPSQRWNGLIIEMKSKGGKLSPHQAKFLETMAKEGYLTKVCFSADEAISLIKSYLMISST